MIIFFNGGEYQVEEILFKTSKYLIKLFYRLPDLDINKPDNIVPTNGKLLGPGSLFTKLRSLSFFVKTNHTKIENAARRRQVRASIFTQTANQGGINDTCSME